MKKAVYNVVVLYNDGRETLGMVRFATKLEAEAWLNEVRPRCSDYTVVYGVELDANEKEMLVLTIGEPEDG